MESPAKHVQKTNNKPTEPQPAPSTDTVIFDEIAGRFQSGSDEDDDSFQIVFQDTPRGRHSPDCDSEDSFIVFEDSPDSCYTSNDVFNDSGDKSDSEIDADDSGRGIFKSMSKEVCYLGDDSLYVDHSEVDEVDCANVGSLKLYDSVSASDIGDTSGSEDKTPKKNNSLAKRVHFSPNPPQVRVMRVWLFAAKQARSSYWLQFAVDRERFQRRIKHVGMVVSWVFRSQHRAKILFQRYIRMRHDAAERNERAAREKLEREKMLMEQAMQILELSEDKHEAHSNVDGDNTNTENSKQEESRDEDLDNKDRDKTLLNTVDNCEVDARDSVNSDTTMGEKGSKIDIGEKMNDEVDCQNSTNVRSDKNENNTEKDLSGQLYGNEILPYTEKKLDTDDVSTPKYVDLNS